MRRLVTLAWATAVPLLVGIATLTFAQGPRSQLEGSKPYTPTRLEWLAVTLNAQMHSDPTPDNEFTMAFVALQNEDAILIHVRYLPSVNRQRMNSTVDTAREVISIESKSRGWSSWLKVKERVEMAESK